MTWVHVISPITGRRCHFDDLCLYDLMLSFRSNSCPYLWYSLYRERVCANDSLVMPREFAHRSSPPPALSITLAILPTHSAISVGFPPFRPHFHRQMRKFVPLYLMGYASAKRNLQPALLSAGSVADWEAAIATAGRSTAYDSFKPGHAPCSTPMLSFGAPLGGLVGEKLGGAGA